MQLLAFHQNVQTMFLRQKIILTGYMRVSESAFWKIFEVMLKNVFVYGIRYK